MGNIRITWLLCEIAKEQEAEETFLLGRIDQLEKLCRDLWADHVDLCKWQAQCQTNDELRERMEQLQLLEAVDE